jgi:phosphoenolpyruvate carboxykinase (GTP)
VIAPEWEDPAGVPISAILFGGRRATVVPLVNEARSWRHGTFLGSIIGSEKTAAAAGAIGQLRRDPMAMLPFCGYNMADYWNHWLTIGARPGAQLPRIYLVNWFRKSAGGDFLWPGFGDNSRVLKWIFERCEGTAKAIETPIGNLPGRGELDIDGLDIDAEELAELLRVDVEGWLSEVPAIGKYYEKFGAHLPDELSEELDALRERLEAARE